MIISQKISLLRVLI